MAFCTWLDPLTPQKQEQSMPTILISAPPLQEQSPLADLLCAFEKSELGTITRAVLVTTENPHVTALLTPHGRILPDPDENTSHKEEDKTATEIPTSKPAKTRKKPGPKPKQKPIDLPSEDSPAGEVAEAAATGITIYTNPLTGEHIPYGQMRALLADRRLVPKERFISNRHGLMEVREYGDRLILVRV